VEWFPCLKPTYQPSEGRVNEGELTAQLTFLGVLQFNVSSRSASTKYSAFFRYTWPSVSVALCTNYKPRQILSLVPEETIHVVQISFYRSSIETVCVWLLQHLLAHTKYLALINICYADHTHFFFSRCRRSRTTNEIWPLIKIRECGRRFCFIFALVAMDTWSLLPTRTVNVVLFRIVASLIKPSSSSSSILRFKIDLHLLAAIRLSICHSPYDSTS